jgi:hypothetical protein
MKKMFTGVIIIGILMTGCNAAPLSRMPGGQNFVRLQTEQTVDNRSIKVIKVTKDLKTGDIGQITVQGRAGVIYKIVSTYKVDNRTFTANQSKAAGKDGIVTWSWRVSEKTNPGTYPLTITGDGTTLLSSYTVTK